MDHSPSPTQTRLKSIAPSSGQCAAADAVTPIPPHLVDVVWPHVDRFIRSAVMRGGGDYSVDYIRNQLKADKARIFVIADSQQKILGAIVIEVSGLPNGERVMVITAFGADTLDRCKRFLPWVDEYAKLESCDKIRLYGRRGWERELARDGYTQPWIALEKQVH